MLGVEGFDREGSPPVANRERLPSGEVGRVKVGLCRGFRQGRETARLPRHLRERQERGRGPGRARTGCGQQRAGD